MSRRCVSLALLLPFAASPLAAQATARPTVVVLALPFDGARANVLQPGDTAVAYATTAKLRATLATFADVAIADSTRVAAAVERAETAGNPCDNPCALTVARAVDAQWVVKGKVAKTSNLVWVLFGELLDVATGKDVLADSYELKGDAARMGPAGADVFAQRVAHAVAQSRSPATGP